VCAPAAERAPSSRPSPARSRAPRELIEVAASETGKVFAEADVEVSEAVDFANYYAATARELDRVPGAVFVPARLTVVTPPWNFPIAIPAGGVLAALAAGSGVVFKPAPQARRCAAVVAEALWEAFDAAGIPRDSSRSSTSTRAASGASSSRTGVDRVILTGRGRRRRSSARGGRLPLLAETSGKNAMIVMPSADLDLAASDLVKSAFGHAGQKCSAASLAILVGPVARSERFARSRMPPVAARRPPSDPRSEVGPVIEAPRGKLAWALTTLEDGEQWLVEPRRTRRAAEYAGRLWRPGIRVGVRRGSRTHLEEFFGPMLGVMHAGSLAEAIELQNAVAYGLTAGLYTQDPPTSPCGSTRCRRATSTSTAASRARSCSASRSAGGSARRWARARRRAARTTSWARLVARRRGRALIDAAPAGLDTRITAIIESAQPSLDYEAFEWLRRGALSDAVVWDREFGRCATCPS
jgi:RHH-type proline utilization regulon transcriptional repressor/proline dehydrogenase/delta 1-pyrroline-5-carboxylate dehydrogenase